MVAGDLYFPECRIRCCNINLPRLNCYKGSILRHEDYRYILYGREFTVIVVVPGKDNLLLTSPFNKLIRPGADGVSAVVGAVSVLGDNADGREGVKEDGRRGRKCYLKRCFVECTSALHICQVNGALCFFRCLEGESNISSRHLHAVCEVGVVPDFKAPYEPLRR